MDLVCGVALACYTVVLGLCHLETRQHKPQRSILRRRLAYVAHALDWLMNILVAVVGVKRLFHDENFGGQYQPYWVKVYFMITGPLPTIGMVGAMITGHYWGDRLHSEPRRRRIHRIAGMVGYVSWWLSLLPIFLRPWLNRWRKQQSICAVDLEA